MLELTACIIAATRAPRTATLSRRAARAPATFLRLQPFAIVSTRFQNRPHTAGWSAA
jgi:hypothetical protein